MFMMMKNRFEKTALRGNDSGSVDGGGGGGTPPASSDAGSDADATAAQIVQNAKDGRTVQLASSEANLLNNFGSSLKSSTQSAGR